MTKREEKAARDANRRTLVKGRRKAPGGRKPGLDKAQTDERYQFASALLDRGATDRQVIDALMRPPSHEPSRPGGLGLDQGTAENVLRRTREKREEVFKANFRTARSDQAFRLRGAISGATADKQFGAVASLERVYKEVVGTQAPVHVAPARGGLREQIGDILAEMSPAEIEALAGEDAGGEDPVHEEEEIKKP